MDEQSLIEYVTRQRWYGAKSRTVSHSEVLDTVTIRQAEPQLSLALVEMRFDTGAHDIYQLLVSGGGEGGGGPSDGLAEDAGLAREIVSAMRAGMTLQGSEGMAEFTPAEDFSALGLALGEIASAPESFLDRLGRLGEVTANMHTALGADANDLAFAPEEPSVESLGLLTATVDEEIARVFLSLPDDDERLAPILGRGEEVREQLRLLTHAR